MHGSRLRRLAYLIPVGVVGVASMAAVSRQPQFRASTDLVRVTATVTADEGRRQIAKLAREDFVITDGGRVQEITLFSVEPQPMSVVPARVSHATRTRGLSGNQR